jgi:small subunit ribosomal protein S16
VVRLRLKRLGRKNRPHYRIAAFDAHSPRDGRALDEALGCYDPLEPDNSKKVTLNRERIVAWLDKGAQPTAAVAAILRKNGIYAKH